MANPFYPPKSARQPGSGGGDLGANYSLDEPGYASPPPLLGQAQRPIFDPHRQRSYQNSTSQPQKDLRSGEYAYESAGYYAYPPQQHQSYYPNTYQEDSSLYAQCDAPRLNAAAGGGLAPPALFGSVPSLDEGVPSRPGTPGIYPDRPPKLEKLSAAQRKIASSFPKDLDKNGGSMWKDMISTAKNWRSYVKWKYTHWYVGLIIAIVLVVLFSYYHRQIVDWLTPMSLKIKNLHW